MTTRLALLGGRPVRTRPFPAWPVFGRAEEARLLRALRSGQWGRLHGDEVRRFEERFAAMHGCRHGIAVANGTVSLRLALIAAGLRAEDEVIVPPYTFFSTASAVVEANMVPAFADVDLDSFNLAPEAVEAAVTARTRARQGAYAEFSANPVAGGAAAAMHDHLHSLPIGPHLSASQVRQVIAACRAAAPPRQDENPP